MVGDILLRLQIIYKTGKSGLSSSRFCILHIWNYGEKGHTDLWRGRWVIKKLNLMIHRTPIAQYLNDVVYTELGLSPSLRVSIRNLWQVVPF